MQKTLHDQTKLQKNNSAASPQDIPSPSLYLKSHKPSPSRAHRSYKSIGVRRPDCTYRVRRASRVSGCSPHRCISCHFVGAYCDSLNKCRRPRHLVRCNGAGAACSASDRAEQITARAICGSRNTSGILVADCHTGLDCVGGGLTTVRRVEGRTGEVLATVYSVDSTIGFGVVPTAVRWAKILGWRGDGRSGRRRNSSAATVRWRKIARRA